MNNSALIQMLGKIRGDIGVKVQDHAAELIEKMRPQLLQLADAAFGPIHGAFALLPHALKDAVTEATTVGFHDSFSLVKKYGWNHAFRDSLQKCWTLWDSVSQLDSLLDGGVSVYAVVGRAQDLVQQVWNDALYTCEITAVETAARLNDAHPPNLDITPTHEKLVKDCHTSILVGVSGVLFDTLSRFWEKNAIRPMRKLVEPLVDAIPTTLRGFLDVSELLDDTMNDLLRVACSSLVAPLAARIDIK
jgi:hypothetical protein